MKDNKAIQSRQNVIGEKGGCCCGGETRGQPGTARESSATVESPAATASSAESESGCCGRDRGAEAPVGA